MSDLNKISDSIEFTSVDIEDFYGDDAPAEDLFSTDIIVLTDNEKTYLEELLGLEVNALSVYNKKVIGITKMFFGSLYFFIFSI